MEKTFKHKETSLSNFSLRSGWVFPAIGSLLRDPTVAFWYCWSPEPSLIQVTRNPHMLIPGWHNHAPPSHSFLFLLPLGHCSLNQPKGSAFASCHRRISLRSPIAPYLSHSPLPLLTIAKLRRSLPTYSRPAGNVYHRSASATSSVSLSLTLPPSSVLWAITSDLDGRRLPSQPRRRPHVVIMLLRPAERQQEWPQWATKEDGERHVSFRVLGWVTGFLDPTFWFL